MAPKPPPPPGPPPPPPPIFGGSAKGGADDRNALLSSIRQGTKLKKTQTVDKSGPYIPGKVANVSGGSPSGANGGRSPVPMQNGGGAPALGGLFAGGMPKLRATGKWAGSTPNGQIRTEPTTPRYPPPHSQAPPPPPQNPPPQRSPDKSRHQTNVGALSAALSEALAGRERENRELSREMSREPREAARELPRELPREPPSRPAVRRQPSDIRTRGPPPQPPTQKAMPLSSSDSVLTNNSILERISSLQQAGDASGAAANASTLHRNKSSLHSTVPSALGGSMTSLSSQPPSPSPAASHSTSDLSERPRINHGKPNLAPKPPVTAPDRPSPPPKKLITNGKIAARTQSMRMPRSPPTSPPSPQSAGTRPFNLPPAPLNPPIGTKNPASHFGTLRAVRAVRAPGVCPPPPPPPPPAPAGAPPPPPPPARHAHPPPPPPHYRHPSINGDEPAAPLPPVRGSSMRTLDLEAKFADKFQPVSMFPSPDPFLRISKGYSSATVAGNKAHAPPPPGAAMTSAG